MATRTMEPPAVGAAEKDSISAYGMARSTIEGNPLSAEALRKIHAYYVHGEVSINDRDDGRCFLTVN